MDNRNNENWAEVLERLERGEHVPDSNSGLRKPNGMYEEQCRQLGNAMKTSSVVCDDGKIVTRSGGFFAVLFRR